jgi:hypothetical protein
MLSEAPSGSFEAQKVPPNYRIIAPKGEQGLTAGQILIVPTVYTPPTVYYNRERIMQGSDSVVRIGCRV